MKKKSECNSCDDLTARLDRLERTVSEQGDSINHWRKRWQLTDEKLTAALGKLSVSEADNKVLRQKIEKKDAQIKTLKKELFSKSSETSECADEPVVEVEEIEEVPPKRPRGKQPGARGFGRKIRSDLPVEDKIHDVHEQDKTCRSCGLEREQIPFTDDSEEIHYSVKLVRVRHKRLKYKRTCSCKGQPSIITAPAPDKLISKGLLSVELWTHILLEKFYLQRPITRICKSLELQGFKVSDGTIASGLKKLPKLIAPLYNSIRAESREATHWQMDETRWRIFTDVMGKSNHQWWLWVTDTDSTTFFTLDPSRSSKVPLRHLNGVKRGVVSCDRYSGYKPLQEQGIQLAYCWAHVRRDFIAIKDGFPSLKSFGSKWIVRIDNLFHYNKLRDTSTFAAEEIKSICELMEKDAKRTLSRKDTHDEVRKVLTSLMKHWSGLTLFLEYPSIPMDNNAAERAIREGAIHRNICLGNHSVWGGQLGAMLFSVFATLTKNQIDPQVFLVEYLTDCAKNRGRPPTDLAKFTPWKKTKTKIVRELAMVH